MFFKPRPVLSAVVVTVATLVPAAAANAGVNMMNHNETLLLHAAERSGVASGGCKDGDSAVGVGLGDERDRNGDLMICRTPDGREYDNHVAPVGGGGGWNEEGCRKDDASAAVQPGNDVDRNRDLVICRSPDGREYDNRVDGANGGGGNGWTKEGCRQGDALAAVQPGNEVDLNGDLAICRRSDGTEYDNR